MAGLCAVSKPHANTFHCSILFKTYYYKAGSLEARTGEILTAPCFCDCKVQYHGGREFFLC